MPVLPTIEIVSQAHAVHHVMEANASHGKRSDGEATETSPFTDHTRVAADAAVSVVVMVVVAAVATPGPRLVLLPPVPSPSLPLPPVLLSLPPYAQEVIVRMVVKW